MTIIFAVMNYSYLTALAKIEPACTIWLQYTAPCFVFLFSYWFLKELPTRGDWLVLVFSMAGAGLILAFEIPRNPSTFGVAMGLLSGVTFAGVVIHLRSLRDFDAIYLIVLNHGVTTLLLLPVAAGDWRWPSSWQLLMLAAFGVLQMGVPYVIFAQGVKRISGYEASGIGLMEPLLVPVWYYIAWSHQADYAPPAWWTYVGGGLIFCGLACRIWADARSRPK